MQPAETDWKIIDILQKRHVPKNTIAGKLNSGGTVRIRLKKLKDSGIMEVKTLINPEVLENKQLAPVGIRVVESCLPESKEEEVSNLENVLSVSIVSGRYDLTAEVLVNSTRGLVKFLTEQLSIIKGILHTETFLTLKSYNKFI
jgi:Lrp/AsnC family transcriptional regulator for asnA, asnC and gidA